MASLRSLVGLICVTLLLSAIVEQAFPDGNFKPVISLVLSYYILLGVFQGIKMDTGNMLTAIAKASDTASLSYDYSEYALSLYQEALENNGGRADAAE